jgi:hypothetical protein
MYTSMHILIFYVIKYSQNIKKSCIYVYSFYITLCFLILFLYTLCYLTTTMV